MSLAADIQPAPRFDSAGAFLAWVELQPERRDLIDGVARMMTGGTLNHGRIGRDALTALVPRRGIGPCEAFGRDVAIVLGPSASPSPDVSVSCEPEDDRALARPAVVIEVPSPSTASCDLGDKASAYRRVPSLRHLVLVRRDRAGAQHFHRGAEGQEFSLTEIGQVDGALALTAIGVEIALADLYARVAFAA